MKILIVDDSAIMRKLVLRTLRQAGFEPAEVLEASDGVEALAKLEGGGISLVLSDVNMPNMSGLELLDRIKSNAKLATVPVVMITTETTPDVISKLTAHGAKGCVAKPFTAESLERVLEPLLG